MDRENDSWVEEYFKGGTVSLVKASAPRLARVRASRGLTHEPREEFEPVSTSAKFIWTGATIGIGRKTYCKGWVIYHPGKFFVVLRDKWNRLEAHQADMQKFFGKPVPGNDVNGAPKAEDDPRYKPDPKKLKSGQIIAIFHRDEWHRGLILECFEDKALYKVMAVDFGEHENFNLEEIRLLPKKFLEFPAQAIRCCLYFDGPGKALNGSKVEWTNLEADDFRKLMDPCMFYMEFVEYEVDWKRECPMIWRCRVQRILGSHDLNYEYHVEKTLVGELLLKRLQKCYEDQQKKKEGKKKMSKVPQSLWYNFMEQYAVKDLVDSKDLNESMSNFDGVFCSGEKIGKKD